LIAQFTTEFNRQYGLNKRLSERVLGRLHEHSWPGNVRELRNLVERLVVTSPADLVGTVELDDVLPGSEPKLVVGTFKERLERFERDLLQEAMREHGSTRGVAAALGLSQSTVARKLRSPDQTRAVASASSRRPGSKPNTPRGREGVQRRQRHRRL